MNDINLLRSFLAVYRAGSVTGAARMLNISQPAVTVHVRTLERRLGTELFIRIPRSGVQPTPAATTLASRVAPHLDALADKDLLEPAVSLQPFTLSGPADLLALFVIPAVSLLISEGMRIHAMTANLPAFEQVAAAEIDMAVTLGGVDHRGLRIIKLMDLEIVFVGAPRWAERLSDSAFQGQGAAFHSVPYLGYSQDFQVAKPYFNELWGSCPDLEPAFLFEDLRALASAVRNGAGIAVLPICHIFSDLQHGRVVELYPPRTRPRSPIFAAVNPANSDPRLDHIIDALDAFALKGSDSSRRVRQKEARLAISMRSS